MLKPDEPIRGAKEVAEEEETTNHRPGLLTVLISLLVLLALLATLVAPLLQRTGPRLPKPTPTPSFLREAGRSEVYGQTVGQIGGGKTSLQNHRGYLIS